MYQRNCIVFKKSTTSSNVENFVALVFLLKILFLGNIYYGTTSKIATNENLWSQATITNYSRNVTSESSYFKVDMTQTTKKKAHFLDFDAGISIGILGGLITVDGSAKFVDSKRTYKNQGKKINLQNISNMNLQFRPFEIENSDFFLFPIFKVIFGKLNETFGF